MKELKKATVYHSGLVVCCYSRSQVLPFLGTGVGVCVIRLLRGSHRVCVTAAKKLQDKKRLLNLTVHHAFSITDALKWNCNW
jgi:hypothetical protein